MSYHSLTDQIDIPARSCLTPRLQTRSCNGATGPKIWMLTRVSLLKPWHALAFLRVRIRRSCGGAGKAWGRPEREGHHTMHSATERSTWHVHRTFGLCPASAHQRVQGWPHDRFCSRRVGQVRPRMCVRHRAAVDLILPESTSKELTLETREPRVHSRSPELI